MTLGTPLYMSPEQFEGRPLDPRSDVYSLGVTGYHLLSGQPPFRGENALAVAVQHVKTPPERLENLRPDLPSALCRVIHKMLAKQPSDRFASATEVLRELRAIARDLNPADAAAHLSWAEDVSTLDLGRWEAAQRLGSLMKTAAIPAPRGKRSLAAAVVVLFFAAGAAAGWLSRPPSLLESTDNPAEIPKKDTAEQQHFYARFLEDPDERENALLAVERYFPPTTPANTLHVLRARQDLARLYLEHNRYDEAKRLFDAFAAMDEIEPQFRAFGIAGQCYVAFRQGNAALAGGKLSELGELYPHLDSGMRELIYRIVFPELRDKLRKQEQERIEEIVRKHERESPGE
jgi:serine/threonine-protein kinase